MLIDFQFLHCWKVMKIATKPTRHYHLILGTLLHDLGKLKMQIFYRYSAHMEDNANKLHFYRLPLLFIHKFRYFQCLKYRVFPVLIANTIQFSTSLFFYLFTFAINLWHRKFVTGDVTAVFVNNQRGIH